MLVLKVQNCLDPCNIQLFHCKLRHMKKKKENDKKELGHFDIIQIKSWHHFWKTNHFDFVFMSFTAFFILENSSVTLDTWHDRKKTGLIFKGEWAVLETLDSLIHCLTNKNYWVVRNAGLTQSRNTWKSTPSF